MLAGARRLARLLSNLSAKQGGSDTPTAAIEASTGTPPSGWAQRASFASATRPRPLSSIAPSESVEHASDAEELNTPNPLFSSSVFPLSETSVNVAPFDQPPPGTIRLASFPEELWTALEKYDKDGNGLINANEVVGILNELKVTKTKLFDEHRQVIAEHKKVVYMAAFCFVVFLAMLGFVISLILSSMSLSSELSSRVSFLPSSRIPFGVQPALTSAGGDTMRTAGYSLSLNASSPELSMGTATGRRLQKTLSMSFGFYHPLRVVSPGYLGQAHEVTAMLATHRNLAGVNASSGSSTASGSSSSSSTPLTLASTASGQPLMPFSPLICTATVLPLYVKAICGAMLDGHAALSVQVPFTTASGTTTVTNTFIRSDGASSVGCVEAVAGLPTPSGVQITYFPDPIYYTYADGSPKPAIIDCPHYASNSSGEPCCISTPSMLTISFAPRTTSTTENGSASTDMQTPPLSTGSSGSGGGGGGGANGFCAPCVCTLSPSISPPPTISPTQTSTPSKSPLSTLSVKVTPTSLVSIVSTRSERPTLNPSDTRISTTSPAPTQLTWTPSAAPPTMSGMGTGTGRVPTPTPSPSLLPTLSPGPASTRTTTPTPTATATATASAGSLTPLPSLSSTKSPTATLTALPEGLRCGGECFSSILTMPLAGRDPVDVLFRCLCQCAPTCRCGYMPGFGNALERLAWKWPGPPNAYTGQPYAATVFPNIHPTTRDISWKYDFCGAGRPVLDLTACGRLAAPTWNTCGGGTKSAPHLGGVCDPQYARNNAKDGTPACPFIVVDADNAQTYIKDMLVINDALTAAGALFVSSSYTTTVSYLNYTKRDFEANLLVDLGRIMFCANSKQVVAGYLYRYYLTAINPGWLANTSSIPPDFVSAFKMGYGVSPATVVGCEKPPQIDSVVFYLRPSVAPVPTSVPTPFPTPKQDSGSCFASDATVETPGGGRVALSELRTGQLVRVAHGDGTTGWERVLYVMHAASNVPVPVLSLRMSARELRITKEHFLPISVGGCVEGGEGKAPASYQRATQTPAGRVRVGDGVWVVQVRAPSGNTSSNAGSAGLVAVADPSLVCVPVVSIRTVVSPLGVRNPLLQGASIIVDGIAASTHTLWPGEAELLPASALAHIPAIHNTLLTPIQAWGVAAFSLPPPLSALVVPCVLAVFEAIERGIDAAFGQAARVMQWPWLLVSALCMGGWVALIRGCLWAWGSGGCRVA